MLIVDEEHLELGEILVVLYSCHLQGTNTGIFMDIE